MSVLRLRSWASSMMMTEYRFMRKSPCSHDNTMPKKRSSNSRASVVTSRHDRYLNLLEQDTVGHELDASVVAHRGIVPNLRCQFQLLVDNVAR
jgi:hypothetical protein